MGEDDDEAEEAVAGITQADGVLRGEDGTAFQKKRRGGGEKRVDVGSGLGVE